MSGREEEIRAAFAKVEVEASAAIRQLTAGLNAGRSFTQYRAGNYAAAAASIAGLTQTERNALHSWARWLIGDDPQ